MPSHESLKLRLLRSLIFWSGLLVIVFILFTWWDSTRAWSWTTSGNWALHNADCGVAVSWQASPSRTNSGRHAWQATQAPEALAADPFGDRGEKASMRFTRPRYFARPEASVNSHVRYLLTPGHDDPEGRIQSVFFLTIFGTVGDWTFYLPHWCLLAGFTLLWAGLLLWRARRRSKQMTHA